MTHRAVIVLAFWSAAALCAHPEIEDALNRLNAQISATPDNAGLYLDRGELYARHEEWLMAEANYLRAAELAPEHRRLPRALGALALATGRVTEARSHLDTAVGRDPADADARLLRARAHIALKARAAALADYNAALALVENPAPELFLERAAVCASPLEAIRGLDEGIARLGPVVTLQLRAAELDESLGRIDSALTRLERLADQSERKESWLKRAGDLLARAGRLREARESYARARSAITALPEWLRQSPDTLRLLAELERLSTAGP